jgi:hypothetical protein
MNSDKADVIAQQIANASPRFNPHPTTTTAEIKLFDIVQLYGDRQQMIVVDIKLNRPANPFIGVLVKGQGAQYKFGWKHRPTVVGHAKDDHPALRAWKQKYGPKTNQPQATQAVFIHLLEAVEAGDLPKAQILAAAIRTMDGYAKPKPSTLFAEYEAAVKDGTVERFNMSTYDDMRKMVKSPEFQNAR